MDNARGINITDHQSPHEEAGLYYLFGIAINKYHAFTELNNARKDIEDIKKLLLDDYTFEPSEVVLLYDEEATRERIIDELSSFRHKLKPADRLLILYSGHGFMDGERGFWIPVDGKNKGISSFVSNAEIRDIINTIKAKHILLISDSCFSGSLLVRSASGSLNQVFDYWDDNSSRYIFISGKGVVSDGKPGENSPFATGIIKHLKQNNDPKINIVRLADEVTKEVRFNYEQQAEHSPLFQSGHAGGQFVFVKRNSSHLKKLFDLERLLEQQFIPFTWHDQTAAKYIPPIQFKEITQAVLTTKIPLIISGEPGVGVTLIPEYFSDSLGVTKPYFFNIKRDTTINEILYSFNPDFDMRQSGWFSEPAFSGREKINPYIKFGVLGMVIKNDIQSVITFHDIDLAINELGIKILSILEKGAFEIPETGESYALSQSNLPVVIFTTKNTDGLPDEFLGSCLLMAHPFPAKDQIIDIFRQHSSSPCDEPYFECLIDTFLEMRSVLTRKPSLSEFIQWIKIISAFNLDSQKMEIREIRGKIRTSLSALLKNKDDIELVFSTF